MTTELAKKQLATLKQQRTSALETIDEHQSRIIILDAQIAALEPLAADPDPATPVAALPQVLAS